MHTVSLTRQQVVVQHLSSAIVALARTPLASKAQGSIYIYAVCSTSTCSSSTPCCCCSWTALTAATILAGLNMGHRDYASPKKGHPLGARVFGQRARRRGRRQQQQRLAAAGRARGRPSGGSCGSQKHINMTQFRFFEASFLLCSVIKCFLPS